MDLGLTDREELERLLQNVLKLGVLDWSSAADPYPLSHIKTAVELREVAAHTAVLAMMFEEAAPSKIPLESYLWSRPVRHTLRELGWLEGGIVLVDPHGGRRSTRLDVDKPARSLRLPGFLVGAPGGVCKVSSKFTSDCFEFAWNILLRKVNLFPKLPLDQRSTILAHLRDWIYRYEPEGQETTIPIIEFHLVAPMTDIACRIARTSSLYDNVLSRLRNSVAVALMDQLVALVCTGYLSTISRSNRIPHRKSFLDFMDRERTDIAGRETRLGVLEVPEGEISFLLLEFLLSHAGPITIGGHRFPNGQQTNLAPLFTALDLLPESTGRTACMAAWFRNLLGIQGCDPLEHLNLKPLLNNDYWIWLKKLYEIQSEKITAAVTPLLNGQINVDTLSCFAEAFARHRQPVAIERDGPINCYVQLFHRWHDVSERFVLAFPLTGWKVNLRGADQARRVAYFVGSMANSPALSRDQQIIAIRALISSSSWATLHNVLEEERAREKIAYFYAHDLYRGLYGITDKVTALCETLPSVETGKQFLAAEELLSDLQSLFESVALIRDIHKLSSGDLPWNWGISPLRERWPEAFKTEHLQSITAYLRHTCRRTLLEFGAELQARGYEILAREVNEREGSILDDFAIQSSWIRRTQATRERMDPALKLPPLNVTDAPEAGRAICSCLVELLRNAMRAIIQDYSFIRAAYGLVHVDYEIKNDYDSKVVSVSMWNPYANERPLIARLLQEVRNLIFLAAVELSTPERVNGHMGSKQPYARSRYSLHPMRLRFEKDNYHARP